MKKKFKVIAPFEPTGDQPQAIEELAEGIDDGLAAQILLGATGTGKTYTIAKVIERVQLPTLVIANNKTLAAQLAAEFKSFFPENYVGYFVSYYDYYQPEAYLPATDTYIEKDASINDEIDQMRHSATCSLFERNDVIIVASVSCIYGLGSPENYSKMLVHLFKGQNIPREEILSRLVAIRYERNDIIIERGKFRVRGDVIEITPAGYNGRAIRIELFGDEVERLTEFEILTGKVIGQRDEVFIFPASHYVADVDDMQRAEKNIRAELREQVKFFTDNNKLIQAQRIEQRTNFDLENIAEMGYCSGIENYSRHLTGRNEGEPPFTLIDYFPRRFLTVIDESHVTLPQIRAMYAGDRSRKFSLIENGFRLPSALDNRPLTFDEFNEKVGQLIYVSATPAEYE
ncbi:MAG: DEAD/DEAH box helicase family protein, partial [Selenomonadaceae bacterium]|nr:DEAD/DEAH box helicase family protein [Selenomonadaceae bacterium]